MSAYDALDGSRYDARPTFHKASSAAAWGRVGEPEAEVVKAPPPKSEPTTRVAPCAARALPGLVVADGVCSVEDQEVPADAVRCRRGERGYWLPARRGERGSRWRQSRAPFR